MSVGRSTPSIIPGLLLAAVAAASSCPAFAAPGARKPADLDGTWEIAAEKGGEVCRIILRAQQSDKGDYFLGMAPACRHAMPDLAKVGRWSMPDDQHLTLSEPTGVAVLKLAATGDDFVARDGAHKYTLKRIEASGRSAVGVAQLPTTPTPSVATIASVAKRSVAAPNPSDKPVGLAGRYAVMRDKRDTGCMLTLDMARAKGGTRAQLAPGCRDQGIVIFDPSAWQIVKGTLVLTARAGHKTHLQNTGEGTWQKDPKEGGKPLGLKHL